jgi:hypothetical protein
LTCSNNLPYQIDSNGCKLCKCRECVPPVCPSTTTCPLTQRFLKDGCPGCECIPGCTNYCENGYAYATGVGSNTAVVDCKCKCLEKDCPTCPGEYKYDQFGCQTCDCLPVYNGCAKVVCNISCDYGYVVDDKNCPTCKCIDKPVCPTVVCAADKCAYGCIVDANKCPTSECLTCKPVECPRWCEFGFRKNIINGCPICECNDKPVCENVVAGCPFTCEFGLTNVSGCTECKCNNEKPCECPPVPAEEPKLCLDKVSYSKYTGGCRSTADNKCFLVRVECPIGIEVGIKGTFTEAQIAEILAKIGVTNEDDVSITKTPIDDGTNKYTFFIKKEGIAEGVSADDVNKEVDTQAKTVDDKAVSYVLQENTQTPGNFGSLLVPLFGLLAFIFF